MGTERNAIGNRMPQQLIEARLVRRIQSQKGIFQIPHQQPLALERAPNSLTDRAHQCLKCCCGRRWHSAQAQSIARADIDAVEKQHMEHRGALACLEPTNGS